MAMEAATGGAIVTESGLIRAQFQDLFSVIAFTFTFDEDSLATGLTSHRDITVAGAALGDFVLIAPAAIDVVDMNVQAFVTAADLITVWATDLSAGTNTSLAGIPTFNGLILRPRADWIAIGD